MSWELDTEREGSTFRACWGKTNLRATGAARDGWGEADGKARTERICISIPYVETFNSKVIESFVPELRSRNYFSCFLCYMYIFCEHFVNNLPNECLGYNAKQSEGEVSVTLKLWVMQITPSLPSLPGQFWPGVVAPDRALSMGKIQLNRVLMLSWIAWNITVLAFNLRINANLNCLICNCFWKLNRIVWNITVFILKLYLRWTELFEIDMFWHLTVFKQTL